MNVTAAPALRYLITAVRLAPDAAAPRGHVAYAVVEAPAQGLRFESTWRGALSQRNGGSDDVWFERMFVPEERMVERCAIGQTRANSGPNGRWLTLVAVYLGIAQAACEAAKAYARARVPSALGAPIATQPHIQRLIGEMEARLAAARALLYDSARWAGGFSLTPRLPLERHFRDARAGLFQPLQDDLPLGLIGRSTLESLQP